MALLCEPPWRDVPSALLSFRTPPACQRWVREGLSDSEPTSAAAGETGPGGSQENGQAGWHGTVLTLTKASLPKDPGDIAASQGPDLSQPQMVHSRLPLRHVDQSQCDRSGQVPQEQGLCRDLDSLFRAILPLEGSLQTVTTETRERTLQGRGLRSATQPKSQT